LGRRYFKHRDIHSGSLDADLGVVHRLAKKIVGSHVPYDVIAPVVAALLLLAFSLKSTATLNFGST